MRKKKKKKKASKEMNTLLKAILKFCTTNQLFKKGVAKCVSFDFSGNFFLIISLAVTKKQASTRKYQSNQPQK